PAAGRGGGEGTVTASGGGGSLAGEATQKVYVSETAPREVRFPFTAEKPGTATFRFKAARGGDSDGGELKSPIEMPIGLESVATYGDTTDSRVEGIVPPKDVWSGIGGLKVTMASTSMAHF